ncbi:hypothetical protein [Acinetobacter higginsii]|uniref:hypothetical protein n=1 Tax=Acinetobacter higginsii TaxID=70347 RepID=UPI00300B6ABB
MKKTIIWSLLTLASPLSHAEELIATAIYDNQKKQIMELSANTKDVKKLTKCAKLIGTEKGGELLKKMAKDKKEKVLELKVKCRINPLP